MPTDSRLTGGRKTYICSRLDCARKSLFGVFMVLKVVNGWIFSGNSISYRSFKALLLITSNYVYFKLWLSRFYFFLSET